MPRVRREPIRSWITRRSARIRIRKVFDADGKVVYETKAADPAVKVPFLVKVSISDLNIRKGPGTDYDRVQFIPIGVYT